MLFQTQRLSGITAKNLVEILLTHTLHLIKQEVRRAIAKGEVRAKHQTIGSQEVIELLQRVGIIDADIKLKATNIVRGNAFDINGGPRLMTGITIQTAHVERQIATTISDNNGRIRVLVQHALIDEARKNLDLFHRLANGIPQAVLLQPGIGGAMG